MIITITGQSGSGKSTLCRNLVRHFPNLFEEVVSCTTRAPRDGEVDGEHYFFLSEETFLLEKAERNFAEVVEIHGKYYGARFQEFLASLSRVPFALFVCDPAGALMIREASMRPENPVADVELQHVLIEAREDILRKRLSQDASRSPQEVKERLTKDREHFTTGEQPPYWLTIRSASQYSDMAEILGHLLTSEIRGASRSIE